MADKTNIIVIVFILIIISACQTLQSPRCEIDYERIRDLQCYPITSYQKWNECVSRCTNQAEVKTKLYVPGQPPWQRPRPYAYP